MITIKQLQDRYPDSSFGHGGKGYYEINSTTPVFINSYGYKKEIVNDKGEVQCFDLLDREDYTYTLNGKEISEDKYYLLLEDEDGIPDGLEQIYSKFWWGKTIDQYYSWPYFPDKEVKAFECVRKIPYFNVGEVYEVEYDGLIRSDEDSELAYWVYQCLEHPEFFKPIYE